MWQLDSESWVLDMPHYQSEPLGARIPQHLEVMQNALGLQGISYTVANPRGSDVNLPLPKSELVLKVELAIEAN